MLGAHNPKKAIVAPPVSPLPKPTQRLFDWNRLESLKNMDAAQLSDLSTALKKAAALVEAKQASLTSSPVAPAGESIATPAKPSTTAGNTDDLATSTSRLTAGIFATPSAARTTNETMSSPTSASTSTSTTSSSPALAPKTPPASLDEAEIAADINDDAVDWDSIPETSVSAAQAAMRYATIEDVLEIGPTFTLLKSSKGNMKVRIPRAISWLFIPYDGDKYNSSGLMKAWSRRTLQSAASVMAQVRKENMRTTTEYSWNLPTLASCYGDFGLLIEETILAVRRCPQLECRLDADLAIRTVLRGTPGMSEWEYIVTHHPEAPFNELVLRLWVNLHSIFRRGKAIEAILRSQKIKNATVTWGREHEDFIRLRRFVSGLEAEGRTDEVDSYLRHPHVADAVAHKLERDHTSLSSCKLDFSFFDLFATREDFLLAAEAATFVNSRKEKQQTQPNQARVNAVTRSGGRVVQQQPQQPKQQPRPVKPTPAATPAPAPRAVQPQTVGSTSSAIPPTSSSVTAPALGNSTSTSTSTSTTMWQPNVGTSAPATSQGSISSSSSSRQGRQYENDICSRWLSRNPKHVPCMEEQHNYYNCPYRQLAAVLKHGREGALKWVEDLAKRGSPAEPAKPHPQVFV